MVATSYQTFLHSSVKYVLHYTSYIYGIPFLFVVYNQFCNCFATFIFHECANRFWYINSDFLILQMKTCNFQNLHKVAHSMLHHTALLYLIVYIRISSSSFSNSSFQLHVIFPCFIGL